MRLRCPRATKLLPWLVFVAVTVAVVSWQNYQNTQGRDVLCRYVNRVVDGARLDRQYLVALSTRPGLPPDPNREAIIRAYLAFGDQAYPHLDCADVRAGRLPPKLPPLPPSPLASTTTTTRP